MHSEATAPRGRRRWSALRDQSPVSLATMAAAAILMTSLAAGAWWTLRARASEFRQARTEELAVAGGLLAQSVEGLLAANELTAARRLVVQTAQDHRLASCRVVLPDSGVLADAEASRITLAELPAEWPSRAALPDPKPPGHNEIGMSFPVVLPGRGRAQLEMTASTVAAPAANASLGMTEAGIGGISVAALVVLFLLSRWSRKRFRGMDGIRRALLAQPDGPTAASALGVGADWGPEARAWNRFVGAYQQARRRACLERTRETLESRQGHGGDLNAACDALTQGLILVGQDMKAKYANGAAAVMLQTDRETMLSRPVEEFIADPRVLEAVRQAVRNPSRGRSIIESDAISPGGSGAAAPTHAGTGVSDPALPGEAVEGALPQTPRQGTVGVLRFVVRPVRREDAGGVMIVVEDITQQRVAEEARHGFVTQATHELRMPLTNIRLYVETALEEGETNPAVRGECLNVINCEVQRLDRMVGDILSVAEIESGTLKLKRDDVRLAELLAELKSDYAAAARDKQIELEFDLPPKLPVIQGDRDKIALGMHNLLGNAVKYTPSGGRVRVQVGMEADRMVMEVSDTGIGIGEEDCRRVFEKFYRAADRRVAAVTGSGLGLAIARDVIRLHGGDITVQSELDKGSTFTLVLPVSGEAA